MFEIERDFVLSAREFSEKCKYSSEHGLEYRHTDLVNALSNLRSALDCLANRTFRVLRKARDLNPDIQKNVYFPCAMSEQNFQKVCQKNLPELRRFLPDIYSVIEACQPYKSDDRWLTWLFEESGAPKHEPDLVTHEVGRSSMNIAGLFATSGEGRFVNCGVQGVFNGVPYCVGTDDNGYVVDHIGTASGMYSSRTSTDFKKTKLEVLPFTQHCANQVQVLIEQFEWKLK